ncbi:NADH:flavin oxidoreductase/NADH oxidase [Afifella sp. IM 167]|uniref:NADH:flavin oxidoreductase/NADH oxidase n=1 Tax=Afifella sp. IM 167 TaxID=2033586 RepID=UPI00351DA763
MKIAGVTVAIDGPVGPTTPEAERPMLFRPMPMRGVTARNRIILGPMSQYLANDGEVTDWHLVHLGQFAMGGAGIVFAEDTAVEPRGRRSHRCAGIYTDAQARKFRRVTDFLKDLGALPAIQIGHGGRRSSARPPWEGRSPLGPKDEAKGEGPWQVVSSSALAHAPDRQTPEALDIAQIGEQIRFWRDAASRSRDAGFDVLEVHGGHGYLINQFLSPVANTRTDGYGGDRAGRMRFALEIVEAVREVWPQDRPLFFRLSSVDGKGGHWDIDDSVALAVALKARGVDYLACSSGGLLGRSRLPAVPHFPGYHLRFSEHIRREADIKTIGLGMITEPEQAEAALEEGRADMIAIAQEMMIDPYWPVHAAKKLGMRDWLDLLPPVYAQRLASRERELAQVPEAMKADFPFRRPSDPRDAEE